MLHFLRKHTIIAGLIFGATILSFVVFMGNPGTSGSGGPTAGDAIGMIDGQPITLAEYQDAQKEVNLNYLFRFGTFPNSQANQFGFDLKAETANRLAVSHFQERAGIVTPDTAVVDWIRQMPAFTAPESGAFDKSRYDAFVTNALGRVITRDDFERFARHELGNRLVSAMGGIPGEMVTPMEAKESLREELKEAKVQLVVFKSADFSDQVEITNEAIQEYFEANQALYREQEKIIVNYIRFASTNYLEEAEINLSTNANLTTYITDMYAARGADSFRDEEGQLMTEEAARAQLRDEIKEQSAKIAARRDANEFASLVVEAADERIAAGTAFSPIEFFTEKAEEGDHDVQISAPFARFQTPTGMNVGREFYEAAYALTETDPFSAPIEGEDGYYVLSVNTRVPSRAKELAEVRAQVENSFKNEKVRELVRDAGQTFHAALTSSMADGLSFSEAVAAAGRELLEPPSFSLRTTSLPEFSFATTGVSVSELKNAAFGISPGDTSDFIPARQNGFVLHLTELLDAEEAAVEAELEDTLADMRNQRRLAAFSDWFKHQTDLARLSLNDGREAEAEETTGVAE